jgi:hypothetical protein
MTRTPLLIELHCRLCGRAYVPTREDLARGPETYHRCLSCRPPAAKDSEVRS